MAVDKVQATARVGGLYVNDVKVVGTQEAVIANSTATVNTNNTGDLPTKVNAILEALRAHGLIDTA